jgi:hypothetical protein
MHDATKVLLGMTQSSFRHVTNKLGSIGAGLMVHLKSDGTITTAAADGVAMGISIGKDLSNAGRTSICRAGLGVPILLTTSFSPVLGAQVNVSDTTGKAGAAGTGFTAINAFYASAKLISMNEDGTETADGCALIDMPGGV